MQAGIYVHVPFCVRKCHYCDFASQPVAAGDARVDAYVDAVCREIEIAAVAHASLGPVDVPTLFFGGGTPSLLSPEQVGRILGAIRAHFRVAADAETTLECNPGTLDAGKARAFRALGINRASAGVQSFDDAELRALGRIHTAAQGIEAFRILREAGFDNVSLDLMFAIPGQTPESWRRTLRQAVDLRPEHVSAYSLIVEPGTPFYEWDCQGKLPRPDEDADVAMFEAAMSDLAAAGYEHYEISNYALSGYRCRHNLIYWHNEPYLGFGPAATSYAGGVRATNTGSLPEYLERVGRGEIPTETSEIPSRGLEMGETMMLGLRLMEGVESARFAARFGVTPEEEYPEAIPRLVAAGLLKAEGGRVALTHRGLLFANDVMAEFLP